MADEWNGIPTSMPPGPGVSLPSNVIYVPENIPHYYDENGVLQVVSISPGSDGVMPPVPPPQYQAPGFDENQNKPINTSEPQCVFGTDPARPELGNTVCVVAGWTPGGIWYCLGDINQHPCSAGGPINKAKREAINNIVSWALTLAALNKLGQTEG